MVLLLSDPLSNWNLEVLVLRVGKTRVPGEKPLRARERTNNKLNPLNYGVDAAILTQATLVGGECKKHNSFLSCKSLNKMVC